jgi:hypothetical protein
MGRTGLPHHDAAAMTPNPTGGIAAVQSKNGRACRCQAPTCENARELTETRGSLRELAETCKHVWGKQANDKTNYITHI